MANELEKMPQVPERRIELIRERLTADLLRDARDIRSTLDKISTYLFGDEAETRSPGAIEGAFIPECLRLIKEIKDELAGSKGMLGYLLSQIKKL